MRVLFLTNIPSPYRVDFFGELGKLCDLTVLYEKGYADDRDESWKRHVSEQTYREVLLPAKKEYVDYAYCPSVTDYLDPLRYEVIVVGGYSTPTGRCAISYMKRHHIPYWISCDGGIPKKDILPKYLIKKYFLSGAWGYNSTADECDAYLAYYGADPERIHRYPFTSLKDEDILDAPISAAQKEGLRAKLGMKESFIFLFVGSFIHRKGPDLLMKAAENFPEDTGLYIVGGKAEDEYLQLRKELGLEKQVHFVEFKEKAELKEYFQAADVFVLPTRYDIWGLVVNEAMANGLPVITTDCCVAGLELVGNATKPVGKLVPADRVPELKQAMLQYRRMDGEMLAEQSRGALERIRCFTVKNMALDCFRAWSCSEKRERK